MNFAGFGFKGGDELSSPLFNDGGAKYDMITATEGQVPDFNPMGVSAEVGILVAVILTFISFIAFIQNGILLTTFYFCRDLLTPTNLFILALSVCDLLVAGLGNPFVVAASMYKHWYFGHSMCIIYGFIMTFLGLTSITLLTAISLDRYILIVRTMRSVTIDCRIALRAIGGCVLYALVWAGMPLLGWNEYVLEASGLACSVNWQSKSPASMSYIILLLIGCLFLPLGFIGFSYTRIFVRVSAISFI